MIIEFDCVDCAQHIIALGLCEVPADRRCAVCHWLVEFVADEAEREAMREVMRRRRLSGIAEQN